MRLHTQRIRIFAKREPHFREDVASDAGVVSGRDAALSPLLQQIVEQISELPLMQESLMFVLPMQATLMRRAFRCMSKSQRTTADC